MSFLKHLFGSKEERREVVITKKFLHTVDLDPAKKVRKEFLFPSPKGSTFLGIKTGKSYDRGAIVYIGISLDLQEVKSKICEGKIESSNIPNDQLLTDFLSEISNLKVGDICKCSKDFSNGILEKTNDRVPRKQSKLP